MTDFIISDLHVPYQDPAAMSVMLKMVQHFRPNNVIMNGDMLDCVQLSRFNREPLEPSSLKKHVGELGEIIRHIQRYSKVKYIEGNHEARVQSYINSQAPELHGLISIEGLINAELDTKIEYVRTTPSQSYLLWNDDLMIGHFAKASKNSCYTVKLLVEQFQQNVVQAHTHRLGSYSITGQRGVLRGFECGCLCGLNPSYTLLPNWQHGFMVYSRLNNAWNMEMVSIFEGECLFRGKRYHD